VSKKAPLTACPSCGGSKGFRFDVKVEKQGQWGEESETTGWSTGPAKVECLDCGYRVARLRAEGVR
jgi:hypothetical protein